MVRKVLLMFFVVAVSTIAAAAGETASQVGTQAYVQPEKHWHDVDAAWMDAFHNPMDGLEMGLDMRLREVYARNLFALDDEAGADYQWQRYRFRWSTKWALAEDMDFNSRLTWEFWGHCMPAGGTAGVNPFFTEKNMDFDEAIFDNLNIQMRNVFDLPLTVTVGRQDIILGTGWLVLEGTPGDGPRTIFFDAIRGTYNLSDTSRLDMIYVHQNDDESTYIEPFNYGSREDFRHLTQGQDEDALIMYYTNTANQKMSYDAYFIYLNAKASGWAAANPGSGVVGVDSEVYTLGGRLFGQLDENWSYTAELAAQTGTRGAADLCAMGTNSQLTYHFNDDKNSQIFVGYEFLSGDDPATGKDEKFDTLWGDWPQAQRGGDLQSYIWTSEGALGEVGNLHRIGVGHSFKPAAEWTLLTQYNLFWADENTFAGGTGGLPSPTYGTGNLRGQMISGLLTYQCCEKFAAHLLLDYFLPGNYYDASTRDDAFFARVNLEWTF